MARPGYRLFATASWGLILVAVLHTIGHFAGRPTDPAALQAFDAMAGYRLQLPLGSQPTILDVFRDLSLTMAIALAGLGLQNVVVGRLSGASPLLMRRLAGTTSLVLGALLGLKAFYRISPPLMLVGVVEVLFIFAWVRLGSGSAATRDAT